MAVNGQVVIRPMMYVALTYDHRSVWLRLGDGARCWSASDHLALVRRLIDGREAVTFLKRVKEIVEDPRRLLLDV